MVLLGWNLPLYFSLSLITIFFVSRFGLNVRVFSLLQSIFLLMFQHCTQEGGLRQLLFLYCELLKNITHTQWLKLSISSHIFESVFFSLGVCVCVAGVRVRAILWCVFLPFSLTGSISSCTKRSSMPTLLLRERARAKLLLHFFLSPHTTREPPPPPPPQHHTHTVVFRCIFLVENFECRKQDVEGTRMAVAPLLLLGGLH